ncbi:MAG TPA: hypothetical protein VFV05_25410 [Methylomirabilota bacterium]|nr:hypothetical protein [Methylomirabilota bacterium]
MRLIAGLVAIALAGNACASTASLTVVPLRGQDPEAIQRDRSECDARAAGERDRAALLKTKLVSLIGGIIIGAGLGLLSLFFSNTSVSASEAPGVVGGAVAVGAAIGFALGDVLGTVAGAQQHRKQEAAYLDRYVRCLDERGYRVTP